jgi:hypothetical protein
MTPDAAKQLRAGMRAYCQSPGRAFDQHQIIVERVDSYANGQVFVMARLPNPPSSMGQEAFVFEPSEIEVLQ